MNVNFSIVPDAPDTTFGDAILPPDAAPESATHASPSKSQGDTTMEDATAKPNDQGTKRTLDEDEEYD